MPFWVEMRCEKRTGTKDRVCLSDNNVGPMIMAGDALSDIKVALGELIIEGQNTKWRKVKGAWVCPHCQ